MNTTRTALLALALTSHLAAASPTAGSESGPPEAVEASDTELAPSAPPVATQVAPPVAKPNPLAVGGLTAGLAGVTLLAGYLSWWDDGEFVPFSWERTGFFGPDTPLGGADKAGHFFSFYTITRATTWIYQRLHLSDRWSRIAGASFAFALGATIETVDGFTRYGFEFNDVVANVSGITVAFLLEAFPRLDRLLGVRMGFVPTRAFSKQIRKLQTMNDYSGMSLHLDLRLAGLEGFGVKTGLARYLTVGVTYGTQDYGPDGPDKRRNFGVFVGANIPELLDGAFGRGKPAVEVARAFTRYYAVPLTEVNLSRDLDGKATYLGFGVPNRLEVRLAGP